MKLPNYTAEASLGPPSIAYTGVLGSGRSRGAIVPAADNYCPPNLDCGMLQAVCFFSLDADPLTCGLYYGCCKGGVQIGDVCRNNPCAPGCPAELAGDCRNPGMQWGLTSVDSTLSAGFSDLSSRLAAGFSDLSSRLESIGRQLRGIARCVCPPTPLTSVPSPPLTSALPKSSGLSTVPPQAPPGPYWSG
jgi:hypothetical protein